VNLTVILTSTVSISISLLPEFIIVVNLRPTRPTTAVGNHLTSSSGVDPIPMKK